jgi:hypothetical protein
MKASQRELFTLKGLLESFAQSTGLRVNYRKSCMVPLNLSLKKPISWLESLVASRKLSLSPTLGCHWAPLCQEWSILVSSWTRWREDLLPLLISYLTLEDWSWLILSFLLYPHMLCVLYSYLSQSSITLKEPEGTVFGEDLTVMLK